MAEIFVPAVTDLASNLYVVKCLESSDLITLNGHYTGSEDSGINGADEYLKKLTAAFSEDIYAQITVRSLPPEKKLFKEFSELTSSMSLGMYVSLYGFLNKREYKSKYATITITGNFEKVDEEIHLLSVNKIAEKFEAVKKYAEEHNQEKHAFIYVADTEIELSNIPDNVKVCTFSPKDKMEYIFAEVFEAKFSEEQTRLLNYSSANKAWDFVETGFYNRLKRETWAPEWNGFFLTGEGETGKTAVAFNLTKYLMETGKVYAPIWITVDEDEFLERVKNNSSKKRNRETVNSVMNQSGKFFSQERLDKNVNLVRNQSKKFVFQEKSDENIMIKLILEKLKLSSNSELVNFLNKHNYILIVDNLERKIIDKVLSEIQSAIRILGVKINIIITSRSSDFDEKYKKGLFFSVQKLNEFTYSEIADLVYEISKNTIYEANLKIAEPSLKNKLIKELTDQFASYPGLIPNIVARLQYVTLEELCNEVHKMSESSDKIKSVFDTVLAEQNLLSQFVLFAFISYYQENQRIDYKNLQNLVVEKIFSGKAYVTEDRIKKSLESLISSNIINKDTSDLYFIKSMAMVYFVFSKSVSDEIFLTRDTFLSAVEKAKIAIKYNQYEILQNILNSEKFTESEINNLLIKTASTTDNTKILQLLIDYGADVEVCDEDGSNLLMIALDNKQENLVLYILNHHLYSDINETDNDGCPALLYGIRSVKVLEMLIEAGADWRKTANNGCTLLMSAACRENPEIMKYVLANHLYSDINETDNDGWSAILGVDKSIEVLKMLIEAGADWKRKNNAGHTLLMVAACSENPEIIKYVLKNHLYEDINETDINGNSTLICKIVSVKVLEMLIEAGANWRVKNNNGATLLMAAACRENPEIMKYVLENHLYEDINETDNDGQTVLVYDIKSVKVLKMLVEAGADWRKTANNGCTLLMSAACSENLEIMKYVLENHLYEDINETDNDGRSAIFYVDKSVKVLEMLIEAGADWRKTDNNGATLLMSAACRENPEIMKYVLENHLYEDINETDNYGVPALLYDIKSVKVLKMLVEAGADWRKTDNNGATLLMSAACSENLEIMKYVLENHLYEDINETDNDGCPALLYDIKSVKVLEMLIEAGADWRKTANNGCTLLMSAAIRENPEIMKYVLENHLYEDINETDNDGQSALLYVDKSVKVLEMLIEAGADWRKKDNDGYSLLMSAAIRENPEIMKYVLENHLYEDINETLDNSATALFFAARNNKSITNFETLLKYGANINQVSIEGKVILMSAAENEDSTILRYMLENHLYKNINFKDNDGNTALHRAAKLNLVENYNLLIEYGAKKHIKNNERYIAEYYLENR